MPQKPKSKREIITISYENYIWYIKALAKLIKELKDFKPNQVVCIATKGIFIGLGIADLLGIKNRAIMGVRRYKGEDFARKDQPGTLEFSRELLRLTPEFGAYVLLIDDLTEDGKTLKKSKEWLLEHAGFVIDRIVTATIIHKTSSIFKPDIFVQQLSPNARTNLLPWIDQPSEIFERTTPEELEQIDPKNPPLKQKEDQCP